MKVSSHSLPVRVGFVILGRREYSKHMLRLRREGHINGQEVPEIILLNSHDGSSSYQIIPGIFGFLLHRSPGVRK